jgi:hypothetical protein
LEFGRRGEVEFGSKRLRRRQNVVGRAGVGRLSEAQCVDDWVGRPWVRGQGSGDGRPPRRIFDWWRNGFLRLPKVRHRFLAILTIPTWRRFPRHTGKTSVRLTAKSYRLQAFQNVKERVERALGDGIIGDIGGGLIGGIWPSRWGGVEWSSGVIVWFWPRFVVLSLGRPARLLPTISTSRGWAGLGVGAQGSTANYKALEMRTPSSESVQKLIERPAHFGIVNCRLHARCLCVCV